MRVEVGEHEQLLPSDDFDNPDPFVERHVETKPARVAVEREKVRDHCAAIRPWPASPEDERLALTVASNAKLFLCPLESTRRHLQDGGRRSSKPWGRTTGCE